MQKERTTTKFTANDNTFHCRIDGPEGAPRIISGNSPATGPSMRDGQVAVFGLGVGPAGRDWAGFEKPGHIQSQSLRGLLEGNSGPRDVAYSEWNQQPSRTGVELNLRTVRSKTSKLTLETISGDGELYDLSDDPDEMTNRFNDPGKASLQKELEDMIRARPGPPMENLPEHEM